MIETTIKQTKRMLKECVHTYLEKDEAGVYYLPQNKQRPVYLEGPAGIGKSEMVRQVAEEEGIGFVSYSMTHHNRQSAVGLPAIVNKSLDGNAYKATEYTMSEIVESVWDAKRKGAEEGILFADEVNCVSETLSAAMLQFLQNKTFGSHQIPEGWVIVAAGNPPEYNKSVKILDAVTRDRLRIIHMKPDREDWLEYAVKKGMHPLVIQYVREHPTEFYCFRMQKGSQEIVTARGWEDLSGAIKANERNGFAVDAALVGEFIQNEQTAISFVNFYRTVKSLISVEEMTAILEGRVKTETVKKVREYEFQKRWAVMNCLYNMLQGNIERILVKICAHDKLYQLLKGGEAAPQEKEEFGIETAALERQLEDVNRQIDHTLNFLSQNIGDGKEAELMVGMMLDNEYFQKLTDYCRLDSLIAVYEQMQMRMETTKKEIQAWMKGA